MGYWGGGGGVEEVRLRRDADIRRIVGNKAQTRTSFRKLVLGVYRVVQAPTPRQMAFGQERGDPQDEERSTAGEAPSKARPRSRKCGLSMVPPFVGPHVTPE